MKLKHPSTARSETWHRRWAFSSCFCRSSSWWGLELRTQNLLLWLNSTSPSPWDWHVDFLRSPAQLLSVFAWGGWKNLGWQWKEQPIWNVVTKLPLGKKIVQGQPGTIFTRWNSGGGSNKTSSGKMMVMGISWKFHMFHPKSYYNF